MPHRARQNHVADDSAIRRALLNWFRRKARPLPWRKTRDPYAVWVSEVMLQQTQVATVVPYYRRFLQAFATVEGLAAAPLERVLELWSGLGYYRRARNLHRAAQSITAKFDGQFPRGYREARSLAGVGDYTARAVLSIAYDLPYAALDGNVARVIARLGARRGHLYQTRFRRAVEQELDRLLSRRRPGDFNQALMELGQTVCLPHAPRCLACPLRQRCAAFGRGQPESYPEPRPRRATELRHLAVAAIRRGGRVLLVRGLDEGLLDDLWNFPAAFGKSRAAALARLGEKIAGAAQLCARRPMAEVRHTITYRSIRVRVHAGEISGKVAGPAFRWFPLARLPRSAVSQLARKIAARLTSPGPSSVTI